MALLYTVKVLWYQGFSNGSGLWGDSVSKKAKNCMILQNQFLGKNNGGHGEQANLGGDSGGSLPPQFLPTMGSLGY